MTADNANFQAFADAMTSAKQPESRLPTAVQRVAVLGGGGDGALVAALSVVAGVDTVLFSAYGRELSALRASGLTLRGDGPVGTIAVDPGQGPGIQTTGELDSALSGADVIVLTGPLHKQRTYAMVLADHMQDGQSIVLPNAGTFGSLEVVSLLRSGGCDANASVVELDGLPWWIEGDVPRLHLSARQTPLAAVLSSDTSTQSIEQLSPVLGPLESVVNVAHTAFLDASAAIELPALLLGGPAAIPGGPAVPSGAVARVEHANFHSLLGESQRALAAALYQERQMVAARYGVRNLPDFASAVSRCAGEPQEGAAPSAGRRAVPTPEASRARVRDLVQGSLQPLVSAAQGAEVDVPNSVAMVQLASTVLHDNLARNGRSLARIGVDGSNPDTVRREVEQLIRGAA